MTEDHPPAQKTMGSVAGYLLKALQQGLIYALRTKCFYESLVVNRFGLAMLIDSSGYIKGSDHLLLRQRWLRCFGQ